MVQVIDNRTAITMLIKSRRADPSRSGWDTLEGELEEAAPLPGRADLLSQLVGKPFELSVYGDLLPQGPLEGARLRCLAYMAGPGVVLAERDPAPGTFGLTLP